MGKKRKTQKKAAGDEQICRRISGKWRCKLTKKKNGSGDDEGEGCSTTVVETRGSKSRKKITDLSLIDETGGIQPPNSNLEKQLPPDEGRCCYNYTSGGGNRTKYRCKNLRMVLGAAGDDDTVPKRRYCEKHYNYYAEYYYKKKKRSEGAGLEKQLPPDEERCCHTGGGGHGTKSRCKNFRMGYGPNADDTVPKTKRCEKHYNYFKNLNKKKVTEEKEDDDNSYMEGGSVNVGTKKKLPPDEQRCVITGGRGWRCKNFKMSHGAAADDANVPKTQLCEKHYNYFAEKKLGKKKSSGNGDRIVAGGCGKIGAKRKHVQRTQGSGQLKSSTKTVVETRTSKRRKNLKEGDWFVAETSNKPATDSNSDSDTIGSANIRKTTSTDENEQTLADATDRWKKLLSCLQTKEKEKSTRGCGESRISILRCVELRNSERVESDPGLHNNTTESCEKPADESNSSKLDAQISTGGRKDSHVHECKAKEKVLNVCDVGVNKHHESESEFPKYSARNHSSATLHLSTVGQNVEGKGLGSSSNIPPKHGSSSQDHLETSMERFANLVSDDGGGSVRESEHFDSSLASKNSLGDPMGMLALKNWNWNKEEMKWKSEADMLSSFEEDLELCLKAICALYRQEISEDPISPKGLYFDDDTLRCTTLAKFLMDEDCKGDLKKSVTDLETLDSKAVDDCKRLATRYSMHLFYIYKNRKDPFFLPATTSSHGEQTSK